MGTIILSVCATLALTFLSGMLFAAIKDSPDENYGCLPIIAICGFVISVGLSIAAIHTYCENKEYPSAKYELKKKVITIEEDNTIKLDTLYRFTHR